MDPITSRMQSQKNIQELAKLSTKPRSYQCKVQIWPCGFLSCSPQSPVTKLEVRMLSFYWCLLKNGSNSQICRIAGVFGCVRVSIFYSASLVQSLGAEADRRLTSDVRKKSQKTNEIMAFSRSHGLFSWPVCC